jgi:hypothetical protein
MSLGQKGFVMIFGAPDFAIFGVFVNRKSRTFSFRSVHNLSNGKGWINRELVAGGFLPARRLADPMVRLGKRLIKERQAND